MSNGICRLDIRALKNQAITPRRKAPSRKGAVAEDKLLAEYERGELRSSVRSPADLRRFQSAARTTLAKNRRLNIRLSSSAPKEDPLDQPVSSRARPFSQSGGSSTTGSSAATPSGA